jgi:hypothetical protein
MENQSNENKLLNETIRCLNALCSATEAQAKIGKIESVLVCMKRTEARKLLDSLHQEKLYEVEENS